MGHRWWNVGGLSVVRDSGKILEVGLLNDQHAQMIVRAEILDLVFLK
jgi:hypothetical protein